MSSPDPFDGIEPVPVVPWLPVTLYYPVLFRWWVGDRRARRALNPGATAKPGTLFAVVDEAECTLTILESTDHDRFPGKVLAQYGLDRAHGENVLHLAERELDDRGYWLSEGWTVGRGRGGYVATVGHTRQLH